MGCVCCRDREKPDDEKLALTPLPQRSPEHMEYTVARSPLMKKQKSFPANSDIQLKPELTWSLQGDRRVLDTRKSLFALAKPRKSLIERGRMNCAVSLGVKPRDSRVILGGLETCFLFTGRTLAQLVQAVYRETKRSCWIQTFELKGDKSFKAMKQQFSKLKSLDHPNVLKMLEVLREGNHLHVVYESTEGGTAEELAGSCKDADEQWVACVMRQVFAALCHCHSRGLEVKSLTLQHILFAEHSAATVKLLVPFNAELEHNSPYMAPELVMDSYVNQANCSWSCGVILSALLVGELGFETQKHLGYEKFKFAYSKWQEVNKHAKALVLALLSRDYRRRPSLEKCMQDPWIAATQTKLTLTPSLRTALRNMARLRPTASLKKALLQLMLNFVLPSEDLKEAKQAFRELDTDMDGMVSEEELRVQFFRLFPEEQAEAALTATASTTVFSPERKLSYFEFLTWACSRQTFTSTEHINAAFHLLDVDKDGEVSDRDLRELFCLECEDKNDSYIWQVLIASVSTSMERGFYFEEFSNYMQRP